MVDVSTTLSQSHANKDVDFERRQIIVRDGKGEKDRAVLLPMRCEATLRKQMASTRQVHEQDLAAGFGRVWLPYAIAEKFPAASREWGWQYVFRSDEENQLPHVSSQLRNASAGKRQRYLHGSGVAGSR